ncbi:MAG: S8 family serine peptidase [Acutalibacteraceae bacterium]
MYIKLAKIISIMCALCVLVGSNIVSAQDNGSERQYVIITKDADKTEDLINDKKIEDVSKSDKTPDIIVANLTERQADRIEDKDYVVCVEEDIVLTGSTAKNIKKKKTNVIKTEDVNQWYLDAIGVENTQKPRSKVKVALLDSGVSYSSDVDVEESINLVDDTSVNPLFLDASGHGTALASVLCAKDNNEGVTGVNPNMELYSAKVLDDNNQASLSKIIESIYWAIENGVDIINMSFGTTVNSQALHNAIKEAAKKDILMIAAAGNTKHQAVQYPAAYNEVVAVGSTDANGELAELTSTGTELELLAPGEKIIANDFLNFLTVTSGTSIATAQVTGVASLLLQKDTTKSSDFIRRLLKTSAKEVNYGINRTAGLVDYSYANDIYNEFAMKYKLGSFNSVNLENTETPEDYTTDTKDIIVDGLWLASKHSDLSEDLINYIGTKEMKKYIDQIKLGAREADTLLGAGANLNKKDSDSLEAKILHGKGNYVASLKFLINFANEVGNIKSNKNIKKSIVTAKNNAMKGIPDNIKDRKDSSNGTNDASIQESSDRITKYLNSDDIKGYSVKQKKYIILGLAFHLIADTFAHRSIVPKSAIDCSANGKNKSNTHFGYGDFPSYYGSPFTDVQLKEGAKKPRVRVLTTSLRCWDAFKLSVLNYQVVEFIDIKYYMNSFDNKRYEDSTDFCIERWNDSESSIDYFISKSFKFNKNIFLPVNGTKLNNFKGYCKELGVATSDISASMWKLYSTDELV